MKEVVELKNCSYCGSKATHLVVVTRDVMGITMRLTCKDCVDIVD